MINSVLRFRTQIISGVAYGFKSDLSFELSKLYNNIKTKIELRESVSHISSCLTKIGARNFVSSLS